MITFVIAPREAQTPLKIAASHDRLTKQLPIHVSIGLADKTGYSSFDNIPVVYSLGYVSLYSAYLILRAK